MHSVFTLNRLSSMIAAPIIWALHFLFCYLAVSLACAGVFPEGAVGPAIAAATAASLALIAYITLLNYRKWRDNRGAPGEEAAMNAFFALNSLLLCGLSAVALAWVAVPAAMLPSCAA